LYFIALTILVGPVHTIDGNTIIAYISFARKYLWDYNFAID